MRGLTKTPKILEAEAADTARAIFPLAMEVKVIEDWTVEGRAERKRIPIKKSGFKTKPISGERSRARMGKRKKVDSMMIICALMALIPAKSLSGESFAPWRKKRRATTKSVKISKKLAKAPVGGKKRARKMATKSPTVRKSKKFLSAQVTLPMAISKDFWLNESL
jgi:hypothetical protein